MMKKLYYLLAATVISTVFSACSLKEDPIFDKSASLRSDENIEAVRTVLQSASNGWLMEYYGGLSFGGYNVMVKFEDDKATVASEKWGNNHVAGIGADGKVITTTSHFKLEQSMGTVLSFDEYNATFHYYSMPNNPDYTYEVADGLAGDFEFRVMKAEKNYVELRGKKNNHKIVMTPIPADKTWESIINEAEETEKYMSSRLYTLAGKDLPEGKVITATSNGGYRSFVFEYRDAFDQKQTVVAPYIVKADGFYFYEPKEVDGLVLDGLVKGTTDDYFVFRNNANLQLDTYMPTLAENLVTSAWYQVYSSVGDYAKPYWDAMLEKLKTYGKNKDEVKIYTATIGLTNDKLVSRMVTGEAEPIWGFTAESLNDGTRIKFNQNSTINNKDGKNYRKIGWDKILNCIYGHTFDLECDYQRRPTWIKMTDVNDPTNVITVYSTPTYFMDDPNYYNNLDK